MSFKLNINQLLVKPEKKVTVINELQARRVLAVVDQGLTDGVGDPVPGQMCVEAAVSYAFGEEHSDGPTCVAGDVRQFKINLNDEAWYDSNKDRGKQLRRVAIAQLGSKTLKFGVFSKYFCIRVAQHLYIPRLLKRLKSEKYAQPSEETLALLTTIRDTQDVKVLRKLSDKLEKDIDAYNNVNEGSPHRWEVAELLERANTYLNGTDYEDVYEVVEELLPGQIAEFAVDVLHELEVPGTQYLYLAPLSRRIKKFWTKETGYGASTPVD